MALDGHSKSTTLGTVECWRGTHLVTTIKILDINRKTRISTTLLLFEVRALAELPRIFARTLLPGPHYPAQGIGRFSVVTT